MSKGRQPSPGSFREEFEQLLEQLATPPVIELGRPLPSERYLPKSKVATCPACHNRALLDREEEDADAG